MSTLKMALSIAALSCLYIQPSYALRIPENIVCSEPKKPLIFRVNFHAAYENAVTIKRADNGRIAMTFNNFYGRGAGREWRSGAGTWVSPTGCFIIQSTHKNGPANPRLPWLDSKLQRTGHVFGFEDGTDNDFNDAVVRVIR